MADGGPESFAVIFSALSDRRRRYALYYLDEQSGAVEAEVLARQIRAWEMDKQVSEVTEEESEPVLKELVHNHLPRLANDGLIEYDRRSQTARLWDHSDLFITLLKSIKLIEDQRFM